MLIAIHQPNYLPWLGYFHKIARADCFVFLEQAQYSRGSYSNRVRILDNGCPCWLTQPVRHSFGQAIGEVAFADNAWPDKHLSHLRNAYGDSSAFAEIWPELADIYRTMPAESLATANRHLVTALSGRLDLKTEFATDGELGIDVLVGDDRLIALLSACGDDVSYLSGSGGRNYQNKDKFVHADISLVYAGYDGPAYEQGTDKFVAGLSVVDALFHLGWGETARLVLT